MNTTRLSQIAVISGLALAAGCIAWFWIGPGSSPETMAVAAGGLAIASVAMFLNVRATSRANTALREENEKLSKVHHEPSAQQQTILDVTARDPREFVSIDANGLITYLNKSAAATFDCNWRDVVGQSYRVLFSEESLQQHGIFLARREVPGIDKNTKVEAIAYRWSGGSFPVDLSFTNTTHAQTGELIVVFVTDLTEKRREEETLRLALASAETANHAKSSFLANMSHEIRTPMTAIIGMAELCMRTELTRPQHDYLKKLHYSARSLMGIINDILDFSKIESGELTLEEIEFDIDEVLDDLAMLLMMKTREKNLELIFLRAEAVPRILIGDPLRLKQVLVNLCNNAIKFTHDGEIMLRIDVDQLENQRTLLTIEVTDTGIGMTEEQLSMLFKPFSQADSSTSRRFGGTGLGLSISKQLVELMNGDIAVDSTEGLGTTFRVHVNLGYPEAPVRREHEFTDLRVLTIVENGTVSMVLTAYLEAFGIAEIQTTGGIERLGRGEVFDLVIVDGSRKNDVERQALIAGIRESDRGDARTLLLDDGGADAGVLSALNVDGVLDKPVNPSSLLDSIVNIFGAGLPERRKPDTSDEASTIFSEELSVLLVEDNSINQQIATELLQQAGMRVEVASTGIAALQTLEKRTFDCVLMDIQMPEMDGYEATKRIRAQSEFEDLPILAMTANVMSQDREMCIAAGMNGHVGKPIDIDELLFEIERVTAGCAATLRRGNIVQLGLDEPARHAQK